MTTDNCRNVITITDGNLVEIISLRLSRDFLASRIFELNINNNSMVLENLPLWVDHHDDTSYTQDNTNKVNWLELISQHEF